MGNSIHKDCSHNTHKPWFSHSELIIKHIEFISLKRVISTAKFWLEISIFVDFKQMLYTVDVEYRINGHHTMGARPTHEGVAL